MTFVLPGYLSINRFGTIFASAHAGMTAEGDNSVLMQVGSYFMITYLFHWLWLDTKSFEIWKMISLYLCKILIFNFLESGKRAHGIVQATCS